MGVEKQVVEDVRDYILDQLDEYDETYIGDVYACELGWELLGEANVNGTITFSRDEAYHYLLDNPMATDGIIHKMIDELGYDWEDIYENGEDYMDYIHDNAERVHVALYIDIANAILGECPTIQRYWNDRLSKAGSNVKNVIMEEVSSVPDGDIDF